MVRPNTTIARPVPLLRQRLAQKPKSAELNNFNNWVNGKSVIFIGPAGYYEEPEDLSMYDVVARCNHSYDLGRRTNILYVNAYIGNRKYADEIMSYAERIGLKWLFTKTNSAAVRLKRDNPNINICNIRDHFMRNLPRRMSMANKGGATSFNMGLIAIEHLLNSPLETLAIRGIDFYETGYYENYSFRTEANARGTHNQEMHKKYFKRFVVTEPRVDIDDVLKGVLDI